MFPSPCGVRVLKSARAAVLDEFAGTFPSPCGVRVLKWAFGRVDSIGAEIRFRPLAGFVF